MGRDRDLKRGAWRVVHALSCSLYIFSVMVLSVVPTWLAVPMVGAMESLFPMSLSEGVRLDCQEYLVFEMGKSRYRSAMLHKQTSISFVYRVCAL